MTKCFHLEIVSVEDEIYSGTAQKLFVTGVMGEMEILVNHAPLLTTLYPGPVWVERENSDEEAFVIHGGILEVQPSVTIVLADTVIRAKDIDEAAALEAKKQIEQKVAKKDEAIDYAKIRAELALVLAQLRVIQKLRKN